MTQLDADIDDGKWQLYAAFGALAAAILVLLYSQWWLSDRTRRIFNAPLVIATLLAIAAVIWLFNAFTVRQEALDVARFEGYQSIELTGAIQESAFTFKSKEAAVLAGEESWSDNPTRDALLAQIMDAQGTETSVLVEAVRNADVRSTPATGLIPDAGRAADSDRERFAAAELVSRWSDYVAVSDRLIDPVVLADPALLAEGTAEVTETYNGFNAAVESVLFDNRTQFEDAISDARSGLDWLSPLMVLLAAAAALFALWGFQQRIREYR